MTEALCTYPGDRDEALVTYLYDEGGGDAVARAIFDAHLATCVRCIDDLAALRTVRSQLARWSPPEPKLSRSPESAIRDPQSTFRTPHSALRSPQWWSAIPVWAQVAAALLFLGVSAAIANLDVRYDRNGVTVRTGWSQASRGAEGLSDASKPRSGPGGASRAAVGDSPWRADLAALERQLKTEFHGVGNAAPPAPQPAAARAAADAEIVRRVRALIDESEKRQQRELALRVAEVIRDVNAQRQADLIKVDRVLGTVQNNLGIQVLKNRAQMQQMDYYIRTSQRQ
jgi:hypothetical protein